LATQAVLAAVQSDGQISVPHVRLMSGAGPHALADLAPLPGLPQARPDGNICAVHRQLMPSALLDIALAKHSPPACIESVDVSSPVVRSENRC